MKYLKCVALGKHLCLVLVAVIPACAAFCQQTLKVQRTDIDRSSKRAGISTGPMRIGTPLFATKEALEQARRHISEKREPFYTAWKKIQVNADKTVNRPYRGTVHFEYFRDGIDAAGVARDAAFVFLMTGDKAYGDKSRDILLSRASANRKKPTHIDARYDAQRGMVGSPAGLVIGRAMTAFSYAYSLVYAHLNKREKADIEAWMTSLVPKIRESQSHWITHDYFYGQEYNNHLSAHLMGLVAIGYTLRDGALLKYAIDSPENPKDVLEMINGAVLMPGDRPYERDPDQGQIRDGGEIYDRYRSRKANGLTYGHLHLALLTQIAEMVYNNNGTDLFQYTGPNGENLERAFEFYADFYITGSSSVKGDYYAREKVRMERSFLYEIAGKRYHNNKKISEVLASTNRTAAFDREVFGWSALLTHGKVLTDE